MAVNRVTLMLLALPVLFPLSDPDPARAQQAAGQEGLIALPAASTDGGISVEKALATRRSQRNLAGDALTLRQLAQLLWAGQGVTATTQNPPRSLRTAPSAGATYPMELYAVVGAVEGLDAGVYRYVPAAHALALVSKGDVRAALFEAASRQAAVQAAPVTLVLAAVVARTAARYGERAERYVAIEVGGVGENIYLQAESLGLGTVYMGAYRDDAVKAILGLPADQAVYGLLPVGRVSAPR
jgi:SagB-type dehydrogenase family enzyme